jgi:hypothetical protein
MKARSTTLQTLTLAPLSWLAFAACSGTPAPGDRHGTSQQAIIDGEVDVSTKAVVLVGAKKGSDERHCSGVVVSPHVVLTAAHCLSPDVLGTGYRHFVWLGDDNNDPAQAGDQTLVVEAKTTTMHPDFDLGTLTRPPLHDIGVVVTSEALPRKPLPLLRHALDESIRDQPVSLVGFGFAVVGDPSSVGVRRRYSTPVTKVAAALVWTSGTTPHGCQGDSGGPLLWNVDGLEQVIGINSWTAVDCTGPLTSARLDIDLAFVEGQIEDADPGFLSGETVGESPAIEGAPVEEAAPTASDGCAVGRTSESEARWVSLPLLALVVLARRRFLRR